MKIEAKPTCPLNNFCECKMTDCGWFIQIRGSNPNTGEEVDDWGCAVAWMPVLTIENSMMQRQTGAAVESFRNEMVAANESNVKLLIATSEVSNQLKLGAL